MYERTLRFFINRFDYKRLDSDGTFCINYIPNLQSECWRHLSPQMFQTSLLLLFLWKEKKKKLMMEESLMCHGPKTWPKWRKSPLYKYLCIFTILPLRFVETEGETGILLPKLFWFTVRKNCSSDREKLLKFKSKGQEQFLAT